MARRPSLVFVLGVACLCIGCDAGDPGSKPDFSGTWVLDLSRSSLEIPAPDSSIFVIDHDEPSLSAERTHVLDGTVNTVHTELTTDSTLTVVRAGDLEIPTRVYWDGDVLVMSQEWTQGEVRVTNLVRYSLEDEGRTLVADETMRTGEAGHHNVWTLGRR